MFLKGNELLHSLSFICIFLISESKSSISWNLPPTSLKVSNPFFLILSQNSNILEHEPMLLICEKHSEWQQKYFQKTKKRIFIYILATNLLMIVFRKISLFYFSCNTMILLSKNITLFEC